MQMKVSDLREFARETSLIWMVFYEGKKKASTTVSLSSTSGTGGAAVGGGTE